MQNRFKFRIWNGSEMHNNDFVVTATGFIGKITEEFLGNCVFNQEDMTADKECILMQCTGMKDKNGTLIYEGDIVKVLFCDFAILYCDKCKSFQCFYNQHCIACGGGNNWLEFVDDFEKSEVIGNIYENKELLERNK